MRRVFQNSHRAPRRRKADEQKALLMQLCLVGTRRRLSYQLASQFASRLRADDMADSTALCSLKCIDTYEKVDAVVLQVITAWDESSVKAVSPVKLREHAFIWVKN